MIVTKSQASLRLFRISTIALTLAAFAPNASSGPFDWPQWQGPERTAHSKETGLLKEWPKAGPPNAWTVKGLGGGDSTPSVADGRIYGMSNRGNDEFVWALSEKDGKELWAVKIAPAPAQNWPQSKEGPSATPTVDGDKLYVMGLAGNLVCLQSADGKMVWQRSLTADFGGKSPMWSFRESPLVDGDKVICTPGGDEATMVALNKRNGETIWKSFVPDRAGGGAPQNRGPGGNGPSMMQMNPLLAALDKDHNKEISADEVGAAPAVLLTLDKDQDGKLAEDEVSPQRGDGGGQGNRARPRRGLSAMRMLKTLSALDADENGVIDEAEIKNSVAALQKLDVNHDGKLTEEEVGMKFMGPQNTGAAYSSPIAIEFGGQRQYVQLLAMTVAGISAADGKLLWRYDKPANGMRINISTPIYNDGQVFASSAYGAGGGLARLSNNANGDFSAEEAWFSKSMENHHGGVILHDGALFGANGGNGGGYLACLDFKTGEVLWNEADRERRRVTKGSVAFADDRIYYRTEEGPIVLIEPSRKEYLERGRFDQPERTDKPAWAHPVIANGKLYIRDQDTLFCYDIKAK
ncbi:MAG TPA: PQQ-binding-like beta-propeller repeat protein [Candidatus Limnocylindria bacterium]|jgi:outer membrane protein assembly factor BamB|nr:PQQ-binding-like beta-propeller repeat protein [Candidatus Limnocylindria bacterium]